MAHYKCVLNKWILTSLVVMMLSTAAQALDNYRATYDISVRGVGAGRVTHEVIFTDNTYRMDTSARPSLAAKMLGFGKITEMVQGGIRDGIVYPEKYQRSMDSDPQYRLVYDYHPAQNEIHAQIGNTEQVLKYDEGIQPLDILSLIAQSLLDEQNHRITQNYTMLTEDKIRTYAVEAMPDEKWQKHNGESIDIHVYLQTNGNRQTKVYFAQNPLRLVKLTQFKDNDARFSLKLMDYSSL